MRGVLLLLTLTTFSYVVKSQDVHFSQFYMQPLTLNPALSGDYIGDLRFAAINRRQWSQLGTPIMTSGFSAEGKLPVYPTFVSLGIQFVADQITAANFRTHAIYTSGAYHMQTSLGKLSFGLQVGWVTRSIDRSSFSFPAQYNSATGQYDMEVFNGENGLVDRERYADIGTGVLLTRVLKKKVRFKTGISLSHLNKPSYGFSTDEFRLPLLITFYQMTEVRLKPTFLIVPVLQVLHTNQATNAVTLVQFRKEFDKQSHIYAGWGLRGYGVQNDAVIGVFGVQLNQLELAVGYDFNISELSTESSAKSSLEISAIYRTPTKQKRPGKNNMKKARCIFF